MMPAKQYQYYWLSIYFITLILIITVLAFPDHNIFSQISKFYCIIPISICLYTLPNLFIVLREFAALPILFFLVGGTVVRIISFASTSSIEEEHQTWYFLWGSLTILGAFEELKANSSWDRILLWILLFAGLRVFRHWNYVGKWAALQDVGDWLNIQDNWISLVGVFVIGKSLSFNL